MNFLNSEGLSRVQTHIQTALDMKADKLQVEKQFTDSVADWNQNDEFALDYVKNRTHWVDDPVEEIILSEENFTIEDNQWFGFSTVLNLSLDNHYTVIFDGVEYQCEPYELYDAVVIGNSTFEGGEQNPDLPFLVIGHYSLVYAENGDHTITINSITSKIHHIDNKYIKDMYGDKDLNNEILLIDNVTITAEKNYGSSGASCDEPFELPLEVGCKYRVNYDGVDYITTCYLCDWGYPMIGDQGHNGFTPMGTNEPFCIGGWPSTPFFVGVFTSDEDTTNHTISIAKISEIVKIDKKYYLAAGERVVGKKQETGTGDILFGKTGAEIFNDYNNNVAIGNYSHAEGYNTEALENYAHAEGNDTIAAGQSSHAEGSGTTASGNYSHAEGSSTTASGNHSHAEGESTKASGNYSHAEGLATVASGNHSHVEGYYTTASGENSHVQGKHNISDDTLAHIVGNGDYGYEGSKWKLIPSNAHTLDWNGNAWFAGDVYVSSTSGKNKDDGSKKLATVDEMNTAIATAIQEAFANIARAENTAF